VCFNLRNQALNEVPGKKNPPQKVPAGEEVDESSRTFGTCKKH